MPHIRPRVIIESHDVSQFLVSCHSEQTVNAVKGEGKYDLTLCNPGGKFLKAGTFAPLTAQEITAIDTDYTLSPKHQVSVEVEVTKTGCESGTNLITIFRGEIQDAQADELFVKIQGSCFQGGMSSRVHDPSPEEVAEITAQSSSATNIIWPLKDGWDVKMIVEDLLERFGIPEPWHVDPVINDLKEMSPYVGMVQDFNSAFTALGQASCSNWYFDANNEFWFGDVTSHEGFSDLNGVVLRGTNASNMTGYCNHVDVYGGTLNDGEPINERWTHETVHELDDWEFHVSAETTEDERTLDGGRGIMTAPSIFRENASKEECKELAEAMLKWYRQFRDVPTIKVVNKAPGLMAKVRYRPWNGSMPPVACDGVEETGIGYVYGLITKRVVDISAEGGFVSTLEVTTNYSSANRAGDQVDGPMDWTSEPSVHVPPD